MSNHWVSISNFLTLSHYFQLAAYESDFKMEREEKNKALSSQEKILKERDHVVQSYEQLKKEHIGLRQNIERMYSQAQQQHTGQVIKSLMRKTASVMTLPLHQMYGGSGS